MGARLLNDGVTLRVWAPHADHVYLAQGGGPAETNPDRELLKDPNAGHWTGFFADLRAGDGYRFYIEGPDGTALKRDPRARELDFAGPPDCDCLVTDPQSYPWHDRGLPRPSIQRFGGVSAACWAHLRT
jgi:1,4-alpha-glucan branching enzyme